MTTESFPDEWESVLKKLLRVEVNVQYAARRGNLCLKFPKTQNTVQNSSICQYFGVKFCYFANCFSPCGMIIFKGTKREMYLCLLRGCKSCHLWTILQRCAVRSLPTGATFAVRFVTTAVLLSRVNARTVFPRMNSFRLKKRSGVLDAVCAARRPLLQNEH